MATVVLLSAAGFLCVSMSSVMWIIYSGVVMTSLSCGFGEVVLLSYSHRFNKYV